MSRWPALPPALRYPAYRNYWLGSLASVAGYNMVYFAQLWLAHELTGSPLFLGAIGAANALPAMGLGMMGGVFADRMDRRQLIVGAQAVLAGLALLLATLTLLDIVRPWHLIATAIAAGLALAFDQPARQAFYPQLIERKVMASAVAMNASIWQGTRIVAPAAAGLLIAVGGTETALYVGAVGFTLMGIVVLSLKVPAARTGEMQSARRELMVGLSFVGSNRTFVFFIGMSFFCSFFGMGYILLMPIFAVDILDVGADGQGFLLGISGVGSLLITIWLGTQTSVGRIRGPLIIGGAALSGLSIAGFALGADLIGSYALSLGLMFLAGGFTSMYMINIMSSLQMMVPDHLRGRVMGLYGITWSIMLLGGLQAGALATALGAPVAVAIGGLIVTGFALGPALANPTLRNLSSAIRQAEASVRAPIAATSPTPSETGD